MKASLVLVYWWLLMRRKLELAEEVGKTAEAIEDDHQHELKLKQTRNWLQYL